MRLFVAIDLPDELQDLVAALQAPVRHLKWVPPERLHMTLHFLGEQPDARLQDIFEALEQVEFEPMELCFEGVGQFRSGVIWLAVEPVPDALTALRRHIGRELQTAGVRLERRRFHPHITLGRCSPHHLIPVLEQVADRFYGKSFCFNCDTFCLKSSVLRPSGALHRTEALYATA